MDATVALVARFAVSAAAISILATGIVVLVWETGRRRGEAIAEDRGPLALVNYAGIAFFGIVGLAVAALDLGSGPAGGALGVVVRCLGLAILAGAGLVAVWGLGSMRGQLTAKAEVRTDTELVTRGAFSLVRHPLYLSILMLWLGGALSLLNVVLGAGFALLVPAFVARARTEERMLVGHFGDAYRTYATRTGMFVPHMRRG